jgi:hypothetical protein
VIVVPIHENRLSVSINRTRTTSDFFASTIPDCSGNFDLLYGTLINDIRPQCLKSDVQALVHTRGKTTRKCGDITMMNSAQE